MNPRPWYKPYFASIIVTLIVLTAIIWANQLPRELEYPGQLDIYRGWPFAIHAMYWSYSSARANYWELDGESVRWLGLTISVVAALMLLSSTWIASELWLRRALRPWQFRLSDLLALLTIVIVLWCWYRQESDVVYWIARRLVAAGVGSADTAGYLLTYPWMKSFAWYIVGPILFAEGCALYVVSVALPQSLRIVLRRWFARQAPA